jgi:hypothetical protein
VLLYRAVAGVANTLGDHYLRSATMNNSEQNETCNATRVRPGGLAEPAAQDSGRRRFLQQIAEALRPHEVEVPPAWRALTEPGRTYPGECFERSSTFITELSLALADAVPARGSLWLMHGAYHIGQPHGWCELPDDVVFDGIFQQFYARQAYYDTVCARPWYKYTPDAAILVERNMPLNPDGTIPVGWWHRHLKLPWADPNNPTEIDFGRAWELIHAAGLNARQWLCRLGASKPGVWLSAAEWAGCVAKKRKTSCFVPEADRRTAAGRTRGIEAVLEANLQKTQVAETRWDFVTLRLEKRATAGGAPSYRFVEVGSQRRSAR